MTTKQYITRCRKHLIRIKDLPEFFLPFSNMYNATQPVFEFTHNNRNRAQYFYGATLEDAVDLVSWMCDEDISFDIESSANAVAIEFFNQYGINEPDVPVNVVIPEHYLPVQTESSTEAVEAIHPVKPARPVPNYLPKKLKFD